MKNRFHNILFKRETPFKSKSVPLKNRYNRKLKNKKANEQYL